MSRSLLTETRELALLTLLSGPTANPTGTSAGSDPAKPTGELNEDDQFTLRPPNSSSSVSISPDGARQFRTRLALALLFVDRSVPGALRRTLEGARDHGYDLVVLRARLSGGRVGQSAAVKGNVSDTLRPAGPGATMSRDR